VDGHIPAVVGLPLDGQSLASPKLLKEPAHEGFVLGLKTGNGSAKTAGSQQPGDSSARMVRSHDGASINHPRANLNPGHHGFLGTEDHGFF